MVAAGRYSSAIDFNGFFYVWGHYNGANFNQPINPDCFQIPMQSIKQSENISVCIDVDGKMWTWCNFDFDQQEERFETLKSLNLSIHPTLYEATRFKQIQDVALGKNYMLMISEEQPMLPKPEEKQPKYGTKLRTKNYLK